MLKSWKSEFTTTSSTATTAATEAHEALLDQDELDDFQPPFITSHQPHSHLNAPLLIYWVKRLHIFR